MFNLILTNDIEEIKIPFVVRETTIAKKWFDELCCGYDLFETDRFTNWGSKDLVTELNNCIRKINNYDKKIDKYIDINASNIQDQLNYLHKFFEDLRGEITEGTEWFNTAPAEVKKSVEKFNILIHNLEADVRTKNHPTIVVTFKNRPIKKLSPEDEKHFTFKWKSGTVYINYCQVGKTALDAYKDRDDIAVVRPQKYYSADFMIKFGPSTPYFLYILRKMLISAWLRNKPYSFQDSNLGMIPVADLKNKIQIPYLRSFTKIKGIECIK